MKERPIICDGETVRAILDGRMTQMRSAVKPQPVHRLVAVASPPKSVYCPEGGRVKWHDTNGIHPGQRVECPYVEPGDHLWVRETYLPTVSGTYYRADFSGFAAAGHGAMYGGWKSAKHMPRSASRLTLEILSVRVERLNDGGEYEWVVNFKKQG